jgi:hypothetical protein
MVELVAPGKAVLLLNRPRALADARTEMVQPTARTNNGRMDAGSISRDR